jgi:hypothetical protein
MKRLATGNVVAEPPQLHRAVVGVVQRPVVGGSPVDSLVCLAAYLLQQRPGLLEVRRIKPLGVPAINLSQQLCGFCPFALALP